MSESPQRHLDEFQYYGNHTKRLILPGLRRRRRRRCRHRHHHHHHHHHHHSRHMPTACSS